jgi:hypothetical protein
MPWPANREFTAKRTKFHAIANRATGDLAYSFSSHLAGRATSRFLRCAQAESDATYMVHELTEHDVVDAAIADGIVQELRWILSPAWGVHAMTVENFGRSRRAESVKRVGASLAGECRIHAALPYVRPVD